MTPQDGQRVHRRPCCPFLCAVTLTTCIHSILHRRLVRSTPEKACADLEVMHELHNTQAGIPVLLVQIEQHTLVRLGTEVPTHWE